MHARTAIRVRALAAALFILASASTAGAEERFIILQSTTSTENSGLFDDLLPRFRADTGIEVRPVIVGTGQALKNAQNGDGDVVLVHAKAAEEEFVAKGYGVERFDVMYNDFVIVGPSSDPAKIKGQKDAAAAMAAIAKSESPFASRADESGTHKKELALWADAAVDVSDASGTWYRETGSGMGATLNLAAATHAYTITDRGTWISFKNKGDLQILVEGDPRLFNQYGVILVNPERHPRVHAKDGQAFIDWLTGAPGQRAIADFRVDGQQLFYPNAKPTR